LGVFLSRLESSFDARVNQERIPAMSERDETLDLEELSLAIADCVPMSCRSCLSVTRCSFRTRSCRSRWRARAPSADRRGDLAGKLIGVFTQRDASVEEPQQSDLYDVGTASLIHKMFKLPDGSLRLIVQGSSG
jgi:hypothetical protein